MGKFRLKYGVDPDAHGSAFYWPSSEQKRAECLAVKRLRPAEFQSVYQCNPGMREGGIFLNSDFSYYLAPIGLSEGIDHPNVKEFCQRFHMIVQAWDTAFEAKADSDPTVCLTAGLLPCSDYHRHEDPLKYGECEPHFDAYLLDLYRAKLEWGDLTDAFRMQRMKWRPDETIVEKRSSGIGLYQAANAAGANVRGVSAQEGKRARVVQGTGAGSVQGWFRLHRVRCPFDAPWVRPYKIELKDFTGDKTGKDDQVDATAHLVTFAIELGANVAVLPSEWRPETVDMMMTGESKVPQNFVEALQQQSGDKAQFLSWLNSAMNDVVLDPLGSICQNCGKYEHGFCTHWRRNVIAFDGCEHFEVPKGRPPGH